MSTTAQQVAGSNALAERRFYPRVAPNALLFVALGHDEEGMLLNVSENGLSISTPTELKCNFVVRVSIQLNGLPKAVNVLARVVWASESTKRAGLQLLDLSEPDREQIRKWEALQSAPPLREDAKQENPKQENANRAPGAARASTAPPNGKPTVRASAKAPSSAARQIPQTLPVNTRRTRSTWRSKSMVANVLWGVVIAMLCVLALFFFRNGARQNLFAQSAERPDENMATPSGTEAQARPQQLDVPAAGQGEGRGPSAASAARNTDSQSALADSPAARNSAEDSDAVDSADSAVATSALPVGTAPKHLELLQPDSGSKGSSPAGGSSASGNATQNSPAQPAVNQAARNPAGTNGDAASGSSTASSDPGTAFTDETSTEETRERAPRSDAPSAEIHLSNRHRAFLNLPGELVLESPSMTMRVERSVLMPGGHVWWPFHRDKTLVVGELVSRVDPQPLQAQPEAGSSVRVRATVDKDGRVESVTPVNGPATLVPAVVRAIREWRYQPTLMDDKPVETECYVVVQFHSPAGGAARP